MDLPVSSRSTRTRSIILGVFALLALGIQHYDWRFSTDNEYIRWEATLAWCDTHAPYLDRAFDWLPFPHWRESSTPPNRDVAVYKGHYYLDKAPGLSLLGCAVHPVLRLFIDPYKAGWREVQALTFLLVTLPSLLFLWFLMSREGLRPETVFLFSLATPFLLYATVFFGILPAGLLAYVGWRTWERNKHPLIAGLLAGGSILLEFPVFPIVMAITGLVLLSKGPSWRNRILFLGGMLPSALILMTYNTFMFGGPLEFSYLHKASKEFAGIISTGVMGFDLPSPTNALRLLFSPSRGLFFISPILLAALIGMTTPKHRTSGMFFLIHLVIISGFVDWKAGAAPGPRHLIAILPFLAGPMDTTLTRVSKDIKLWVPFAVLASVSLLHTLLLHVTVIHLSLRIDNPIYQEALPLLLSGCGYFPILGRNTKLVQSVIILFAFLCGMWLTVPPRPIGSPLHRTLVRLGILVAALFLSTSLALVAPLKDIKALRDTFHRYGCTPTSSALWWINTFSEKGILRVRPPGDAR